MGRPRRGYLVGVVLALLLESVLPCALGLFTDVSRALVIAALVMLVGLLAVAVVAHRHAALTGRIAFALGAAAISVTHATAAIAALELTREARSAPDVLWLSAYTCTPDAGALVLLCPVALGVDLMLSLLYGMMWIGYALEWVLRHYGAPTLFAEAGAWLLAAGVAYWLDRRGQTTSRCTVD